jgi:hypothetical protein
MRNPSLDVCGSIQVSAFTTWEQELNKINSDSRYLLLTAKERKQEFDRYTFGIVIVIIEYVSVFFSFFVSSIELRSCR